MRCGRIGGAFSGEKGEVPGRRRDNERCFVWYKSDFWIAFGVSRSSWPRIGIAVDGGLQDTSHRL